MERTREGSIIRFGRRQGRIRLRPELYSDPEFKDLVARTAVAVGGLEESDAARLLLSMSQADPRKPPACPSTPGSPPS